MRLVSWIQYTCTKVLCGEVTSLESGDVSTNTIKRPSNYEINIVKLEPKCRIQYLILPFNKATSLGRSFSSMFEVRMLCEDGRISRVHKNSSIGEKMRTL